MVGHEHVLVADFLVGLDGFDHVDVTLVGVDLDEVVAVAADVAEVDVEDLVAGAEVADDVVDLGSGVGEHLGDGSLAEVEAVVGAFFDSDEVLKTVDRA